MALKPQLISYAKPTDAQARSTLLMLKALYPNTYWRGPEQNAEGAWHYHPTAKEDKNRAPDPITEKLEPWQKWLYAHE